MRALGCSSGSGLDFHNSRKLWLPLVSVFDQLLLVVEQLLVMEGGVLEVGALNDSVDGARFLAETTENALGHIDIVLSGSSAAIGTGLRLNLDSESRAGSFAKLASNASLLSSGVSAEGVLTTEHGGEGTLFPRVVDNVLHKT